MSTVPIPPKPGQPPLLPKRGRPRKYPEGTTDAERMRTLRAEKKRLAEIKKTLNHDDTESRGRYLADADKGKGLIRSGSLNIERIQGWAQINEIYGSASALDELTDDEFIEKLNQVFTANPDLARRFNDFSLDEIRDALRNHLIERDRQSRPEEGRQGKVRAKGKGPDTDPENIALRLIERHFRGGRTPSFDVRISSNEQNHIDDCLSKLRDDPRYLVWIEPTQKVGSDGETHREGIGHFQCQLCGGELHTLVSLIRDHFVDTHRKELRRFFKEKGLRFHKAYLGIFERSKKMPK